MAAVDHELTLRAAKGVADAYGDAVSELLRIVAGRLALGITDPGWAEAKLAETVELRRAAQVLVDRLVNDTPALVADALDAGWTQGIRDAGDIGAGLATTNTAPLQALTRATVGDLNAMAPRILRSTVDAYRDIIATSTTMTTTGTMTRLQATQRALDRFADSGITGFVDRSGRRWELESYAEMATRTATGRAQVDATLGRLSANGRDLVIVSNAPEECSVCRRWESKVLSISGVDRRYPTVKEATSAGLLHAGCRHRLTAYIEGVTRPETNTADPEGDRARQEQRRLERGVRQWKRREAAAIDPDAQRMAKAKARDWQARLKAHVDANDLKRRPERERLGGR
ncbi:MAG: phage minor capsid protein [Acidimicrobiales bacterium]|nr:phage minor capsid protein [Acidimicrobiales bacterium]